MNDRNVVHIVDPNESGSSDRIPRTWSFNQVARLRTVPRCGPCFVRGLQSALFYSQHRSSSFFEKHIALLRHSPIKP